MSSLVRAAGAVWEFIAGEDSVTAIGVVIAVGLAAIAQAAGVSDWWVVPAAVLVLLAASLRRARPPG
jgi:hypothetical protein